jgi:hypothetical protein
MSLQLIDSEEDFDRVWTEHEQANPELTSIKLSLNGPSLPETTTRHIETKINRLLEARLRRHPREDIPPQRQGELAQNIQVSLEGVMLPDQLRRRLETEIQNTIVEMLESDEDFARTGQTVRQALEESCVCVFTYEPGIRSIIIAPPKPLPWKIGWFLPRDGILIEVSAANLPANEMLIGFKNETPWPKELIAWHMCWRNLTTLHQPGLGGVPHFMRITNQCGGADTVVARRPGFIVWDAVGFLDRNTFWAVLGGKSLMFTWRVSV